MEVFEEEMEKDAVGKRGRCVCMYDYSIRMYACMNVCITV